MNRTKSESSARRVWKLLGEILLVGREIGALYAEWRRDANAFVEGHGLDEILRQLGKFCALQRRLVEALSQLEEDVDESQMSIEGTLETVNGSAILSSTLRTALKYVEMFVADVAALAMPHVAETAEGEGDGAQAEDEGMACVSDRVVAVQMCAEDGRFPVTVTVEKVFALPPLLTRILALLASRANRTNRTADESGLSAVEIAAAMKEDFGWDMAPHSAEVAVARLRDAFGTNGLRRDLLQTRNGRYCLTLLEKHACSPSECVSADVKWTPQTPEYGAKSEHRM